MKVNRTEYGFDWNSTSLESPIDIGSLLGLLVKKGVVTIEELELLYNNQLPRL